MDIRITSYREINTGKEKYISYHIEIAFKEWKNIIERRFSEFSELNEVMGLIKKIIKKPIPTFPSKMIFKKLFRKITQKDIEMRRIQLENYLRELEKSSCAKHSKYFPEFLGLPLRYRDDWAVGLQDY